MFALLGALARLKFAMKSDSCIQHTDLRILDVPLDSRRFTYSKDVLWILDYLSRHGKILKLKLGFCGRRTLRMSKRDGDFLNALKGVKTDELDIGDPRPEVLSDFSVRVRLLQSMPPLTIETFFHSRKPVTVNANFAFAFLQTRYCCKIDLEGEDLLKAVMVRPLPLKDLDPRLEF